MEPTPTRTEHAELVPLLDGMVDLATGAVHRQPPSKLSPTEARLLAFLADNAGRTVPRGELLEGVWGLPATSPTRTLYATIQRLRSKVEPNPSSPALIVTVGRTGYRLEPPRRQPDTPDWARPLDGFVGRRPELDEMARWLADPSASRTLYLEGPRGIGTSRLALAFAEEQRSAYRVRVVSLAGMRSIPEVTRSLAALLGLTLRSDGRDPQRLARVLAGGRPALLVLDDAHDLADALPTWLDAWQATGPKVVVVSEQAPSHPSLSVGPLDVAPGGDAEALFLARARGRWPGWRPSPEEADGVRALVEGLHGSPLAIELAVVPSMVFGPRETLHALRGDPEGPGLAAKACIDFAWHRLHDTERQVLQACAAFVDWVAVPRLEALLSTLGLPLHPLSRLVDVGLVELREHDGRRLRIARAARAAVPAPTAEEERQRAAAHAAVFGALGSEASIERLVRHGRGEDYALRSREMVDLLRAASHPSVDGAMASRLAIELLLFRGLAGAAIEVADAALARKDLPAELAVWLLRKSAEALRRSGRRDEAEARLHDALSLAREQAPSREGSVLHTLATFEADTGSPERAEARFLRSLEVNRAVGDRFREGLGLGELGTLYIRVGRHGEAERRMTAALAILREVDAPVSETIYLGNLAVAQMAMQRHDVAEQSLRDGLRIAQGLRAWRFEMTHLSNLGLLEAERDNLPQARHWYEQALAKVMEEGDHMEACATRTGLAALSLREGRLAEARRQLDLADAGIAELGLVWPSISALLVRSALCRAEGAPTPDPSRMAAEIVAREGYTDLDAWCRAEQGLVALAQGDLPSAEDHAVAAAELVAAHDVVERSSAGRALSELRKELSSRKPPR